MMRSFGFMLAGGVGSAVAAGTEAAVLIQGSILGPDSTVDLIQVAFLLSAIGVLLYAGRLLGRWEQTQHTLLDRLGELEADNKQQQKEINFLQGVAQKSTPALTFDLSDPEEE